MFSYCKYNIRMLKKKKRKILELKKNTHTHKIIKRSNHHEGEGDINNLHYVLE